MESAIVYFFLRHKNQCAFSPFQNCYIKMSWHMCLKCKIHKREKNPFNVDGTLLLPFLHGTKCFPSLSFMTRFKSHLFTDVWRMLHFFLGFVEGRVMLPHPANLFVKLEKILFYFFIPTKRDSLNMAHPLHFIDSDTFGCCIKRYKEHTYTCTQI